VKCVKAAEWIELQVVFGIHLVQTQRCDFYNVSASHNLTFYVTLCHLPVDFTSWLYVVNIATIRVCWHNISD